MQKHHSLTSGFCKTENERIAYSFDGHIQRNVKRRVEVRYCLQDLHPKSLVQSNGVKDDVGRLVVHAINHAFADSSISRAHQICVATGTRGD